MSTLRQFLTSDTVRGKAALAFWAAVLVGIVVFVLLSEPGPNYDPDYVPFPY